MDTQKLINDLKKGIAQNESCNDATQKSWAYEEGVLLSGEEAELFLNLLVEFEKSKPSQCSRCKFKIDLNGKDFNGCSFDWEKSKLLPIVFTTTEEGDNFPHCK